MWHHPGLHPISSEVLIFLPFQPFIAHPSKICIYNKGDCGSKYLLLQSLGMPETIIKLSDAKNHPFYEKNDFFLVFFLATPVFQKFQPLHGVTTRGYQLLMHPKNGGPLQCVTKL